MSDEFETLALTKSSWTLLRPPQLTVGLVFMALGIGGLVILRPSTR